MACKTHSRVLTGEVKESGQNQTENSGAQQRSRMDSEKAGMCSECFVTSFGNFTTTSAQGHMGKHGINSTLYHSMAHTTENWAHCWLD